MEVHAHTHTPRKKWTHYLWEFLMLFLAVFCGFMAENIREHKIEQHRAEEFAKSLVQDLQNDTAAIATEEKSAWIYISVVDSLLQLSKSPLEGRQASKFSFYTRFTYWTVPVSWNRNTFEQIKNSGSLRYFKNSQLLKKLLEYDGIVNEVNSESNANSIRGNMLLPLINSIIEPALHHELSKHFLITLDTMSNNTREIFFSYNIRSLENKREKVNELLNMIVVQQRNFQFQINTRWRDANSLAIELISDLKKEYHLK
jgi:predicted transposase YbfD/YdcC